MPILSQFLLPLFLFGPVIVKQYMNMAFGLGPLGTVEPRTIRKNRTVHSVVYGLRQWLTTDVSVLALYLLILLPLAQLP